MISKEEVEEQIANAEKFCEAVQGYLRTKNGENFNLASKLPHHEISFVKRLPLA